MPAAGEDLQTAMRSAMQPAAAEAQAGTQVVIPQEAAEAPQTTAPVEPMIRA
jgi:hypothetical protein